TRRVHGKLEATIRPVTAAAMTATYGAASIDPCPGSTANTTSATSVSTLISTPIPTARRRYRREKEAPRPRSFTAHILRGNPPGWDRTKGHSAPPESDKGPQRTSKRRGPERVSALRRLELLDQRVPVAPGDQPDGPVPQEVVPAPGCEDHQPVAETDQVIDVDEQPRQPPDEPAHADAVNVRDGRVAADRGHRALVHVSER